MVERIMNSKLVARITPLRNPTVRLNILRPNMYVINTHPVPSSAAGSLAANSVNPKIRKDMATSQLNRTGLSKNGSPLNLGVIQSPLSTMIFEVIACIPSSISQRGLSPKSRKNMLRQQKKRTMINKISCFFIPYCD